MADANQTDGASGGGSADTRFTSDTQAGSPSDGGIPAPQWATHSAPAVPAAAPRATSTALLRQMAEATQAIAASTANIVARMAALEQAQQGRGQQQQAGQPQISIGSLPGPPPLATAQPLSWPPRVLSAQPLQGLPEQTQLAAGTAAIKAIARLAAEVWRSMAGTKYFIARGSFSVAEPLTQDILGFTLKEVASVSPASTKQLQHLAELVVQNFFRPAPVGETPVAMPADVHFRTFLAAFGAVLEYGMGSAPAICKTRVTLLKQELDAVLTQLQTYLQYHYLAIHPYPTQVRAALLPAINAGPDVYMHELAKQAGALWNEHPHMPPPAGSGPTQVVRGSKPCWWRAPRTASRSARSTGNPQRRKRPTQGPANARPQRSQGGPRQTPDKGGRPPRRATAPSKLAWWNERPRRACASTPGAATPAPGPPAGTPTTRWPLRSARRPRLPGRPRSRGPRRCPSASSRRPPLGAARQPRAGARRLRLSSVSAGATRPPAGAELPRAPGRSGQRRHQKLTIRALPVGRADHGEEGSRRGRPGLRRPHEVRWTSQGSYSGIGFAGPVSR